MDDFTYDCVEKKRIARGAYHKVRHTGCTLQSDHLTASQLKKKNGKVVSLKLGEPMAFDDFRSMSIENQKTYILYLKNEYDASDRMLAEMFLKSQPYISKIVRALGCSKPVKRADKITKAKWSAFCNGVVGGGDRVTKEEEKTVPTRGTQENKPQRVCTGFRVSFENVSDWGEFYDALKMFPLMNGSRVTIEVN